MCGEHQSAHELSRCDVGSSPHVRGALLLGATVAELEGIIPACAGSTQPLTHTERLNRDHPRMCGEHAEDSARVELQWGSSPHVRGALHGSHDRNHAAGIIPACAGSTSSSTCATRTARDHPRMCGEHSKTVPTRANHEGSSPHVRGAHVGRHHAERPGGIIPACAGSTWSHIA